MAANRRFQVEWVTKWNKPPDGEEFNPDRDLEYAQDYAPTLSKAIAMAEDKGALHKWARIEEQALHKVYGFETEREWSWLEWRDA